MVEVRIENKEPFIIYGIKTWISGTDNELFAQFWNEQLKNGNVHELQSFSLEKNVSVTKSQMLGLSNTSKDPNLRSFDFYIAVETNENPKAQNNKFHLLQVKAYKWAIFSCEGNTIDALMECEMYCWTNWLPNNGKYIHDYGPEMEVYFSENKIEYWIPIIE